MGREVKRVPLDFKWPLKKIWDGYLMPKDILPTNCEHCDGSGSSPEMRALRDKWYGYAKFRPEDRGSVAFTESHPKIRAFAQRNVGNSPGYYGTGDSAVNREATRLCRLFNEQWSHHLNQTDVDALIERGRLNDLTHRWEGKWVSTGHHPTAQEVNDWSICGMGHDSINQWIVCGAEAERLGFDKECKHCDGEGHLFRDDAQKAAYNQWERTEPPSGEGWQMWENTSEGSPMSPVFKRGDELAGWLANTSASSFGSDTATYEEWLSMIEGAGWAMDMVISDGQMMSGVSFMGRDA